MNYHNSHSLFERAQHSIPGGVNSPVRAFKSVGGEPVFFRKAKGAYLYDVVDKLSMRGQTTGKAYQYERSK